MSKTLDWSAIATVNFDDNRRKAQGIMTGKELFAKAHAERERAEAALALRAHVEPLLRKALADHMINRKPIQVLYPINNPTESLGGLAKSQDDDDGFYQNSGSSRTQEAAASAKYEEVLETIPAGTSLVFKSWDKQLDQWIFKSANGREYAVYTKGVIIFKGNSIENPGLYGLLFNTDIKSVIEDSGEE